jgi:riboflavin kinase / FMN adenylyltransferase
MNRPDGPDPWARGTSSGVPRVNRFDGVAMVPADLGPTVVTVGMFDGVHRGHRALLDRVAGEADARGLPAAAVTFDRHPLAVLRPGAEPPLLTTLDRKVELLGEAGMEVVLVLEFTRELSEVDAEAFADEVLFDCLGARAIVVGENFRFGHKAAGDQALLRSDERFETRVVALLEVDGEVVSSSHIRGLVLGGAVEYADKLLGSPFTVAGEVVQGDQRGRTLGFPTANLVPRDGYVVPGHGVYACRAQTADGAVHVAATNVGVRPMFVTGRGELIEAFLVDFDGDLYGSQLRVEFLKRLRGEKRFESVDALVEQMGRDVEDTRAIAA